MEHEQPRVVPRRLADWTATFRRAVRLPLIAATAVLLTSCAPQPVADDEGHASFAREAIKMLLGRPARGYDEVKLVGDIAQLYGREAAARMLMKEPEFIENWTDIFLDLLQIQREGGNLLAAQDKDCWGPPTRPADPAIASWVRDHAPGDPGAPQNWNMIDLVRSALALDDLSPIYRANLFPLSMRRADWDVGQDDGRRDELASRFLRVYLNRDPVCLGCHNPAYSASNKTGWTRLFAIPGHAEKALFGNYYDSTAVRSSLKAIMRGDVRQRHHPSPPFPVPMIYPWGMAQSCARDSADHWQTNDPQSGWVPQAAPHIYTKRAFRPAVQNSYEDQHYPSASFGSLQRDISSSSGNKQVSVWELEGALKTGIDTLKTYGYVRQSTTVSSSPLYCDVNAAFDANACKGCHNAGPNAQAQLRLGLTNSASQLVNIAAHSSNRKQQTRVVPTQPGSSELSVRVAPPDISGYTMPSGASVASLHAAVNAWIAAGAPILPDTSACVVSSLPDVDPDAALAFTTATNLIDGIWMAAMGQRLTIAHGYSRNEDQMNMLRNLTEFEFLPNNWSLQTVLTRIVTSKWYARRAPSASPKNSAYQLQPILDPWNVEDPTVAPPSTDDRDRRNGEGELVDRFRVSVLLRSIGAALGWSNPPRIPDVPTWVTGAAAPQYPTDLANQLGQYISPALPGFKGINFQSLLALEAETGLCNKTGRASAPSDWIDTVVSRINAFNSDPQHAVSPITLGEAWVMLKDRLIQDPTFNTVAPSGFSWSEYDALNAFLNAVLPISSGTTTATSATASFLGTKTLGDMLREGCGILVKSPQFVLTNITPKTYSVYVPAPLRLNVCLGTEPCGYAQLCGHYRETLGTMGRSLGCLGRGVYDNPSFPFDPNANAAGRLVAAPSSGQTWAMLTRQTSDPPAVRLPAPSPAAATREPEFDLIARVRPRERLKGLNRVAQRFATLCPGGLCGFLARPAPNIARCLENPANNVCRVLFPPCDPRSEGGAGSCGSAPADFGASGVLAAWAEGAEVKSAANARLLRSGEQVWQLVRAGIKLQAGDLIDLPFTASLRLTAGNVTFGDQAMEEARVSGLRGHLLAVTGPSAEKLLAVPMRRGALSPADLIKGEQAGAYRSRVMTQADLRRAAPLSTVHVQAPAPSRKEMMERNAQFDELHRGFPWGGRPRERPR